MAAMAYVACKGMKKGEWGDGRFFIALVPNMHANKSKTKKIGK